MIMVVIHLLKHNQYIFLKVEYMVKKARGNKIKVIFQRLHMTSVIFVLIYNLYFGYIVEHCMLDINIF